jgi:hypothetical protein
VVVVVLLGRCGHGDAPDITRRLRGHHHLQKDSELLGYVKRCAKVVREGGIKENITNCPDVNDEVGSSVTRSVRPASFAQERQMLILQDRQYAGLKIESEVQRWFAQQTPRTPRPFKPIREYHNL